MKTLAVLMLLVGLLAVGCATTGSVAPAVSMVGTPVQALIEAAEGQTVQYFDAESNTLDALVPGQKGSVSIRNAEETGQDNYTFDENGIVTKHLRSYGEDYPLGKWKQAK